MRSCRVVLMLSGLLAVAASGVVRAEAGWWMERPMRLVQTNLREIDADMDLDVYIRDVKEVRADVVLFNVGGIVANYPTELEFHYRNTNMKGDLVGEVIKRLHAEGMRMIGRFDFSKINEALAAKRPEWLYVSEAGKTVNYNGQVHACINGGYQQEYLFKILGEAIDRYPLDGIFFNMIGYVTSDYSGNYHGVCQCDACRKRFKSYCGLDLPANRDAGNPVWGRYEQFKRETSDELFHRVNAFIKAKRKDIAICTYTAAGVDIIRKESNDDLGRWNYSATENVKTVMDVYTDKVVSNAAVHFPDYPFRHSAVSPHLTAVRLAENMAHGGWLDYYCIGPIQRQQDRAGLPVVKAVFGFHAENAKWLGNTDSAAQVCLVRGERAEYQGLFRILTENHIAFDIMDVGRLIGGGGPKGLDDYSMVVLPDVRNLSGDACARLDAWVRAGGRILATGQTAVSQLKSSGVGKMHKRHPQKKGTYLLASPGDKLRLGRERFELLEIIYLEGDLVEYETGKQTETMLGLIDDTMFGPPEKCYYRTVTETPGLLYSAYGKGGVATIPWSVGRHYNQRLHHAHNAVVAGTIEGLLEYEPKLMVETSPLIEVSHRRDRGGRFEWVALINHSGQNGTVYHAPVPVADVSIKLKADAKIKSARCLAGGKTLELSRGRNGSVECVLGKVDAFEIVVFEYD